MGSFIDYYMQQRQRESSILGAMLNGGLGQAPQQQLSGFQRKAPYNWNDLGCVLGPTRIPEPPIAKPALLFYDKLRNEIDEWLKP